MININGQPYENRTITVNTGQLTQNRVAVNPSSQQSNSVSTNPIYGPAGRGITNIEKTNEDGLYDIYTISYTDGTFSTFRVKNGDYISNIELTSTEDLVDTYTITLDSGNTYTFTVTNGEQGPQGEQGIQGETGATGNGISNIEKTSTSGLVDTYTITYTNGDTDTFKVTNGQDGTDGQDGQDGADGYSLSYVHEQGEASGVWVIHHNLNKYPSVTVVDTAGTQFLTEVEYNDLNTVTVYMNGEIKGKAYLN